ncbi:hypothetical protein BOTBODRAFT_60325 [Botryobasidium botryosum FD-172 SS1]|uniref:Elongation of fatty acids protein n=1 Tax=Botryobasidium botryosum (strain FD-172 SS1) TaxID=930990 RepID=A0A067LX72_BOTB1|nr:hypothetical protein BOTBODRAFT_60325 [Botryobasidium botryosum FD-172 SS1]
MSLADLITAYVPNPLPAYLTSYQRGVTPLSTPSEVGTAIALYLAIIFSLREFMRGRDPIKLNTLFQIHNVYLTLGSGLLLVLMVEEIVPIVWKRGLFYGICGNDSWTPKLEFYYIINYYIKYLELLDTVFLALKKKPLAFLHVFHHSATALLCYVQLNGRTSVSWVPIVLNLTVHVFMYYYYYATAGGRRIWWKKYLTSMQITQFIIDLFVVYYATTHLFLTRNPAYSYIASMIFPDLPGQPSCAGSKEAAIFGCSLLTSYLFLFIDFYFRTYKPASGKGKKVVANGNGYANGHAFKAQ